jgi:hypothetical protein
MSGFEKDRERLDEEFEEVVDSVYPEELGSYVGRELSTASLTPALLCLLSARTTGGEPDAGEAAGIQFVHAGLDATRRVLDGGGWEDAGVEPVEEDMVLLAADVLVTVGFDHLLDHYETATRVVNAFGSNKAREMEADGFDESFEYESEQFVETYTAAVEIGCDEEPPENLISFAESLAVSDCLADSSLEGDGREYIQEAKRLSESVEGHQTHVAAIRDESGLNERRVTGVEAQD